MSKAALRCIFLFFWFFVFTFSPVLSNGILNGNGENPDFFSLDRFTGALIFQYQHTTEQYEFEEQILNELSRDYLETGLQLNMSGSIYHPGLLTFNVDFKILSFRSKEVYFSDAETNNDVNDTYHVNLSFLNKRKLNFLLYALKDYNSSDRRFSDRYYVRTEKYGLGVTNVSDLFPFRLNVFRLKRISESLSFRERDEQSDHVELDLKLTETPKMKANYRFRWKDYGESVYQTRYRSLDMIADWFFFYGKEKNNLVSSLLSFRKMTSSFSIETLQFHTHARHYFRKDLHAAGLFSVQNNSYSATGDTSTEMQLSLGHRLFDSLESEVSGGFNLQRSDAQDYNRIYTGLRVNYRKRIPSGFLSLNYMFRLTDGRYFSRGGAAENSRPARFNLSDSVILHIYGIRTSSIRITDQNLSQLYVEGVDYEIETDGISVIITRIPGGNIPSGGGILITYEFQSAPEYNSDLRYTNFGVSVNFLKYFRAYYRDERNSQDIVSDFLVLPYEQFGRELYGISFSSKWMGASIYREDYRSRKTGYTTLHYNVSTRVHPLRKLGLSASWSMNNVDYTNGELFGRFTAVMGEVNYLPYRNLKTRLLYRRFRYETFNSDRFRESLIMRFSWIIRKIILDLYFERILNSFGMSQDGHNYFSLSIRRNF